MENEDEQNLAIVLAQLGGGRFAQDAGAEFAKLVEQCRDRNSPGSLTIKIEVNPNEDGPWTFATTSKVVPPQLGKRVAHAWVDDAGKLTRQDPAQVSIFESEAFNNA
jgi:hypothetical protein